MGTLFQGEHFLGSRYSFPIDLHPDEGNLHLWDESFSWNWGRPANWGLTVIREQTSLTKLTAAPLRSSLATGYSLPDTLVTSSKKLISAFRKLNLSLGKVAQTLQNKRLLAQKMWLCVQKASWRHSCLVHDTICFGYHWVAPHGNKKAKNFKDLLQHVPSKVTLEQHSHTEGIYYVNNWLTIALDIGSRIAYLIAQFFHTWHASEYGPMFRQFMNPSRSPEDMLHLTRGKLLESKKSL